ncbi:MAG: hypothetical protein ACK56F_29585, partial [bacterium]
PAAITAPIFKRAADAPALPPDQLHSSPGGQAADEASRDDDGQHAQHHGPRERREGERKLH